MSMPSVRGTISEPIYYHREYENDVADKGNEPSWMQQSQRVATVALPFFSLYRPLSLPISLGMGTLRAFSNANQLLASIQQGNSRDIPCQLLQTTIAVVALAGTIFAHPAGMLITTGHDIIIETIRLVGYLQRGEHKKALESCANIVNNALYLALFTHGGLDLAIASLGMQVLIGVYHAQEELRAGRYFEAAGYITMSLIRGNQMAQQVRVLGVSVPVPVDDGTRIYTVADVYLSDETDGEWYAFFWMDDGSVWKRTWWNGPVYFLDVGQVVKIIPMTSEEMRVHSTWGDNWRPYWITDPNQTADRWDRIIFKWIE
jgi:hypothetical protein